MPGQEVLGSKILCLPDELLYSTSRYTCFARREVRWKIQNKLDYADYNNGRWERKTYEYCPPRAQDFHFERAALLLTCRQIYEEAKDVFYENSVLRLPDDEVLQCLLSVLSPASKASIRSMELMYYSPGDPPEDEECGSRYLTPWYMDEEKQREAWAKTLKTVAEELTGLTNLTLFIYFDDCYSRECFRRPDHQAGLDEKWAHPLMALKKCPLVSLDVIGSCHLVGNMLLQELLGPGRGSSKLVRVQQCEWEGKDGHLEWKTHGTTAGEMYSRYL